ncbi:hypothetical protein [Nonomuraea sp. NPDC050643]|uniref:hypothetical protein n=1 Tax=Nonomuraea sp. NPDC050643 TaxID=3155660 RepID=UPI0033E8CDCA
MAATRIRRLVDRHAGPALRLAGLTVTGDLDLGGTTMEFDLELVDCVIDGALLLTGASGRRVDLTGTSVRRVAADALRLTGDFVLRGARVGDATGVSRPLAGSGGPGGDRVVVAQRVLEHSVPAVFRASGARIDGDLVLEDTRLVSDRQWTLFAERMWLGGSLKAARLSSTGALYLRQAHIGGQVLLNGADAGGVDLTAGEVSLGFCADWGFTAHGEIRLRGAQVGNVVTFHDALLSPPGGALNLARLRTPRLRLDFRDAPGGWVVLRDAQVDSLVDAEQAWPAEGRLDVEGLGYRRIASTGQVDAGGRVRWLTRDRRASAGSFEQLALSYERSGDARGARIVRRARERHTRAKDGLPGRLWGALQDLLFGYGYVPHRALGWLLVLVAAGSTWFALRPPGPTRKEGPAWDPVLYTLDLIIPIANLGHRAAWNPLGADKVVAVVLILAGWLLATAVIAGVGRVFSRS